MTPQGYILLLLSGVAAIFIAMHFIGTWMERRGWIYYRRKSTGGGGATAGLLNEFQKIVEPQIEHRIQVMEERDESVGQRLGRGDDVNDDPPVKSPPA